MILRKQDITKKFMENNKLTKIEKISDYFFKREDELAVNSVCGGKVRVVLEMIKRGISNGIIDFVTCGSRDSRQCEVVAKVCECFGVYSHLFMPSGKETDITLSIENTKGATIHRTKVGYNNVLMSQSFIFSAQKKYAYIPFGLECQETIDINMHQVKNIPDAVKRIVVPCGGGMNMIAIIKGLDYYGMVDKEVVGVVVGKEPKSVFEKYIRNDLFASNLVKYSFVYYPYDYHTKPKETTICGIELDEVYEAKCIPFLEKGDLLWIVGKKLKK